MLASLVAVAGGVQHPGDTVARPGLRMPLPDVTGEGECRPVPVQRLVQATERGQTLREVAVQVRLVQVVADLAGERQRLPGGLQRVGVPACPDEYLAVLRRHPARPGNPGYFQRLIRDGQVQGPMIVTTSVHDRAVREFYPLGAGARGDVSFEPTKLPTPR